MDHDTHRELAAYDAGLLAGRQGAPCRAPYLDPGLGARWRQGYDMARLTRACCTLADTSRVMRLVLQ